MSRTQRTEAISLAKSGNKGLSSVKGNLFYFALYVFRLITGLIKIVLTLIAKILGVVGAVINYIAAFSSESSGWIDYIENDIANGLKSWKEKEDSIQLEVDKLRATT